MKRKFAALGAALATAAALVVLVGSTAFAQVPGGYGYGPGGYGYGSGGYGYGPGGYGMMGHGMMGGYYGRGYQQAPNSGYYGPQPQAPNASQGYYGWGQPMGPGMMGGYHGGWDW